MMQWPQLCPCCRRELPEGPDIIVSLDTNTVTARGIVIRLPPAHTLMMRAFVNCYPSAVTHRMLHEAVWGDGLAPADPKSVIRAQLYDLRRTILPLGVTIASVRGHGYRLSNLIDIEAGRRPKVAAGA